MSLKSVSAAWRAFTLAKETAFGTPGTPNTSLVFGGKPFAIVPGKVWTNGDEFTGDVAPTRARVLTWKMDAKQSGLASPHNLALFLSWLLNSCVSSEVSAGPPLVQKHKISMNKGLIECPTRTLWEYNGARYLEYPGVGCSQVSLSCDREDFLKIEATMIGMGKSTVVTPDPTRPAQVLEDYLSYGDADIKRGGTYNGTAVSGGTSIAPRVKNFKIDLGNGLKSAYLFNDNTGFSGRAIRARMLDAKVSMTLEYEDETEMDALKAGTPFVLEIPVVGALIDATHHFEGRFIFPRVSYAKVEQDVDDGVLIANVDFNVMADPTYGALDVWIQNSQPSYL